MERHPLSIGRWRGIRRGCRHYAARFWLERRRGARPAQGAAPHWPQRNVAPRAVHLAPFSCRGGLSRLLDHDNGDVAVVHHVIGHTASEQRCGGRCTGGGGLPEEGWPHVACAPAAAAMQRRHLDLFSAGLLMAALLWLSASQERVRQGWSCLQVGCEAASQRSHLPSPTKDMMALQQSSVDGGGERQRLCATDGSARGSYCAKRQRLQPGPGRDCQPATRWGPWAQPAMTDAVGPPAIADATRRSRAKQPQQALQPPRARARQLCMASSLERAHCFVCPSRPCPSPCNSALPHATRLPTLTASSCPCRAPPAPPCSRRSAWRTALSTGPRLQQRRARRAGWRLCDMSSSEHSRWAASTRQCGACVWCARAGRGPSRAALEAGSPEAPPSGARALKKILDLSTCRGRAGA